MRSFRFRFNDATRDSVDAMEFGHALIKCRLDRRHPFVQAGNLYYVTVGVVRSRSITVVAEDEDSNKVALDVDALQNTIGAIGEINIGQGKEGELTYKGKVPLAFGVELLKLDYDETENKFNLLALRKAQQIREDSEIPRDFIGDPQTGDVFIAVPQEKRRL